MDANPALNLPRLDPRRWPVDPRVLTGLLPTLAFWIGFQRGGVPAAIVLGLVATVAVFLLNRRNEAIGALALMGLAVAAGTAAAGLIAGSERVFLAREPVSDFLSVAVALGTLAYGRSLGSLVLRELFPWMDRALPIGHPVFVVVTLVWAAANLTQGVIRASMLWGGLGVGQYLIASRGVSTLTNGLMLLAVYFVLRQAMQSARIAPAPVE